MEQHTGELTGGKAGSRAYHGIRSDIRLKLGRDRTAEMEIVQQGDSEGCQVVLPPDLQDEFLRSAETAQLFHSLTCTRQNEYGQRTADARN